MFLAHRPDELQVLGKFAARAGALGYECAVLDATGMLELSPSLKPQGLLGGLFGAAEVVVVVGVHESSVRVRNDGLTVTGAIVILRDAAE